MLSVASLASLRFVEKKQEIQDEKLDELECQLARLENRLESRFKLPNIDPSTLDKEYMTLDEMEREAFRLWSLIAKRDIPDKESILKELDDARHKLEKWEKAYVEQLCYIDPKSKKYSRNKRLREREEALCRHRLVSVISRARSKFSEWEWERQREEREREKDSPEELTPGHAMRQVTTSSFVNPATVIIQARANAQIKEGLKGWKRIAVNSLRRLCRPFIGQWNGCL